MAIRDKIYTSKDIDFNGNDVTYHVGTFYIDGDLEVTGLLNSESGEGIDMSTSDPLVISGDSTWSFKNNDMLFLYFNNETKNLAIGYDIEGSSTFGLNPPTSFSVTGDFTGTGFLAESHMSFFENRSNAAGSSVMKLSINSNYDQMTSANRFLSFSSLNELGNDDYDYGAITSNKSSSYESSSEKTGLRVFSRESLFLESSDITSISGNIIKKTPTISGLKVNLVDPVPSGEWFNPQTKEISFYDGDRRFYGYTSISNIFNIEAGDTSGIASSQFTTKFIAASIQLPDEFSEIGANKLVSGADVMVRFIDNLITDTGTTINTRVWYPASSSPSSVPLSAEYGTPISYSISYSSGTGYKYYLNIFIPTTGYPVSNQALNLSPSAKVYARVAVRATVRYIEEDLG